MSECGCYKCSKQRPSATGFDWLTEANDRMIVCEHCGNKRCPHSTDHELACTGSNEPGQPGSRYSLPGAGGQHD